MTIRRLVIAGFGAAVALVLAGACGGRTVLEGADDDSVDAAAPDSGSVIDSGSANPARAWTDKVDLLLVVDNSAHMATKHRLSEGIAELVRRLTSAPCVDDTGVETTSTHGQPCPAGTQRLHPAVRDMQVGVITTSIGGHGADTCSPAASTFGPQQNDRARLLPSVRPVVLSSYLDTGVSVWDPDGQRTPPGSSDRDGFINQVAEQIAAVGEGGCGFEAPLEPGIASWSIPIRTRACSARRADRTTMRTCVRSHAAPTRWCWSSAAAFCGPTPRWWS